MFNSNSFFRSGLTIALFTLLAGSSASAFAQSNDNAGVALSATRVIFDCSSGQGTSLTVHNSDKSRSFLVQNWASDADGSKSKNLIVTPPLFMMKPGDENQLRILYAGPPLPSDRETLFWLTSKSIPSVDKNATQGKNVLQLAIAARIKGFCRPAGLTPSVSVAPTKLTFHWQGGKLTVTNPTPYYITLAKLNAAGKSLSPVMVSPKESASVTAASGGGAITYQVMNDYGALSPVMQGHMA